MKARISSGGSIPSTLPSWRLPLRKAVWMSKDFRAKRAEAAYWRINIRESLPKVGASRSNISSWGSSKPSMTSLALGLKGLSPTPSDGLSTGFHVNTQRLRRICSAGIWLRAIFLTVSVDIHDLISLCLACRKSSNSPGVRFLSLTSVLCFFMDEARNAICSGISCLQHWEKFLGCEFNGHFNPLKLWVFLCSVNMSLSFLWGSDKTMFGFEEESGTPKPV